MSILEQEIIYLLNRQSGGKFPTPINMGPLLPFDKADPPDWPDIYTTFPPNQIIPSKPKKDWPFCNWFSMEIPGLPFIPGWSSSEHPEMLMTYGLPLYPEKWYVPSLIQNGLRGHTHFMSHWGVAKQDAGWSVKQFVEFSKLVKQYVPFHHVMLAGKGTGHNDSNWDDPNGIRSYIQPVLEALVDANAVDMVGMFESDAWNIPGPPFQSILNGIKSICGDKVDEWVHFTTYVTAWPEGGVTRGEWWKRQEGILKGILYQGNVDWSVAQRQEVMRWTTNKPSAMPQFADGTFKFCAAELDGMSVFDPNFSESISKLHGYEYLCTPGVCPITGTCSGGSYPNGNPLFKSLES